MTTDDFFRARLDGMVDLRHPLAVPARKMPRPEIETSLAPLFAQRRLPGAEDPETQRADHSRDRPSGKDWWAL